MFKYSQAGSKLESFVKVVIDYSDISIYKLMVWWKQITRKVSKEKNTIQRMQQVEQRESYDKQKNV